MIHEWFRSVSDGRLVVIKLRPVSTGTCRRIRQRCSLHGNKVAQAWGGPEAKNAKVVNRDSAAGTVFGITFLHMRASIKTVAGRRNGMRGMTASGRADGCKREMQNKESSDPRYREGGDTSEEILERHLLHDVL